MFYQHPHGAMVSGTDVVLCLKIQDILALASREYSREADCGFADGWDDDVVVGDGKGSGS